MINKFAKVCNINTSGFCFKKLNTIYKNHIKKIKLVMETKNT